ncbi:DnaK suppressor protein [Variovorax sp. WDL1]|uniref:RNA polymerase-binding protein DksA n=1 Tax=Variovorax sp. WDL1 TaxID=207745 RepID=UPI00076D964F|nr:C4-type zinc finger protein, DksA/TraR family [Variovorax sp. WDL1]PNG60554.1 RNA polymerase-binding transcription factor DksA [Variovorax sp. B2]VTV13559.1 DnaK suppressor protein [Variovorax sp. WDL1]
MKKPVAQAKPVSRPAVEKTAVAKQAAPAAKKVSAPKTVGPVASPKPFATSKAKAAGAGASSTKAAGPRAAASASPIPARKAAAAPAAATPAMTTPNTPSDTSSSNAPAPARGGRVSRLSQLTVPSMPQSVASTAAKSSFVQDLKTALVPPPPVAIKKDPKLANNWKTKSVEELTDAEVIAMPDSEYMNEKQMAFFRLKLQALKRGILENAGETTEHLREDTVVVPDPADRATIEEEHALELRTRDRERKLLKKIEQSIQRIDAGDYGYCDETGEPIGVGRLLARPTATLSLEAQQRRELKQKMFGD